MPQPEEFSIAEATLHAAMGLYKAATGAEAYDQAALTFATAYNLADDVHEPLVAVRAARGAAESFDQASGRTGTDSRTDLWLNKAIAKLYGVPELGGFDPGSDEPRDISVTHANYQPFRECVQTLNVAGKLLLRRGLHAPSTYGDAGVEARNHTRTAYGLLGPLEKFGNAQFPPTGSQRHDQYFVDGLAPYGFSELLYGSRLTAARVAATAVYLAPATESSAVLNRGKLSTGDRLRAVKVASGRAGALAVAVVSPEEFARKLARKAV